MLVTAMGLQMVRVFIPTLLFYQGEVADTSTIMLGVIGLTVFVLGGLAGPVARLFGLAGGLLVTGGGVALLRAAEQLSQSPPVDLVLSAAGSVAFFLFVPLAIAAARSAARDGAESAPRPALAILLGVALDTALHIAVQTYDLSWQAELPALLVVLVLVAAALLALGLAYRGLAARQAQRLDVAWRRAWPLLAFGPWLVLQLLIFQNVARAAAVTGWSLPAAGLLVTVANAVGLLVAARLRLAHPLTSNWLPAIAGLALVVLLLFTAATGPVAAVVILLGQPLAALLFMIAVAATVAEPPLLPDTLRRTTIAFVVGQILLAALLFTYMASFDLALGVSPTVIPAAAALLVGLAAVLASAPEHLRQARLGYPALAALSAALFLAPAALWLLWDAPPDVTGTRLPATVQVMSFNLHNGFNTSGRLDLEALAAVIEESDADVVVLQEVSRGWVHAGAVDMLSWLAHRLEMHAAAGPTSPDNQWGNAILSRYPLDVLQRADLPPAGMPLNRGYIMAEVDLGDTPLRVIATHLHHITEEGEIREEQVPFLISAWGQAPRTVIAGDLNAHPGTPEMDMLDAAGLLDAGLFGPSPGFTSPADAPRQRIDYIWVTPDLVPVDLDVIPTTASDHLPIVAELQPE